MSNQTDLILIDEHILPDVFRQHATPSSSYVVFERSKLKDIITEEQMDKVNEYQDVIFNHMYETFRNVDDTTRDRIAKSQFNLRDIPSEFKINFEMKIEEDSGKIESRFYGTFRQYVCTRKTDQVVWVIKGETPLELAELIHDDPIGRNVIRINGLGGNANPNLFDKINCYHVDTVEGLKRFVELVDGFYSDRPIKKQKYERNN